MAYSICLESGSGDSYGNPSALPINEAVAASQNSYSVPVPANNDQDSYGQPASNPISVGGSYEEPLTNSLEQYEEGAESVIDLIGDYVEENDDLGGYGDSESTLFIDIASPLDTYAARKREAKPGNYLLTALTEINQWQWHIQNGLATN